MINKVFNNKDVNLAVLKDRAYNLRWATQPEGVIPLTAADPDFTCSKVILSAIREYSDLGYFSYTPAEGLPALKSAMHYFLMTKRNYVVPKEQILPINSAAFGIFLTCQTVLQPGDEAILFDPVDFLFQYSICKVGASPVRFSIPPGTTEVDFTQLEKLITPRTRLICLCNPLNPTGKVFKLDELKILGEIAVKHNLVILSDEIWSDIVFKPAIFTSIGSISEEISNRVVLVTGFSKSYGLAGLRIGIIASTNDELFSKLFETSLHESTIHGTNSIGQIAATAALQHSEDWLNSFVHHLESMRDLVVTRINAMPGLSTRAPEGCYVSLIDIRNTGMSSQEFHTKMLKEAKVAIVPGLTQWFGPGAEGYVRLSFATSTEILEEALNRMESKL